MFTFSHNNISYTLEIPGYPVNLFVDHFVYMEGESLRQSERLFPNNKTEIFFNLGGMVGGKTALNAAPYIARTMVSGVRRSWFEFSPPVDFCMIGLRFTLFGFHQLFKIPADHFTDNNFAAEDVWGTDIRVLYERLQEKKNCQEMFATLDNWIVRRLARASVHDVMVWHKMETLLSIPQGSVTELLNKHMGYSHKHSIQLIKNHSGLVPKDIQKIVRFDRALKAISQSRILNWADFASGSGYADQSHFIRDFKTFTGYTPGEYLNERPHEYHFHEVMPVSLFHR